MFRIFVLLALSLGFATPGLARTYPRPLRIAVLDFGKTPTGLRFGDQLATLLTASPSLEEFQTLDRDQTRAAALGAGYLGSINMTLQEARDLASVIGCDFFFTGDAQTLRRSPSEGPAFFESYAAIYLVSGRTGKLVSWQRISVVQPNFQDAEKALLPTLKMPQFATSYQKIIKQAQAEESAQRASAVETRTPVIEIMSDDQVDSNGEVRPPKPFRRLKPPYPETAARTEVEAIVDVLVDIDARGEVVHAEIARWAGYGLDESVLDTVKQMHFFPAMRQGVATPMRVLLRYNFRKPPKTNQ
ncbi:MAG: energy transducer TonB [Acidobacteriota bacterium]